MLKFYYPYDAIKSHLIYQLFIIVVFISNLGPAIVHKIENNF